MEHVVFYQSAQGVPAFRRLASLEDAVSFAEHLRNVEGVTDFSVYSLSPVTLSTRTYYHVEVSGSAAAPTAPEPATAVAEPSPFGAPSAVPAAEPQATPPPLPDAPPMGTPLDPGAPAPSMSFNALEEEATAPLGQMPAPVGSVPFAAAPLPPSGDASLPETFVKDDPSELPPPADAADDAAKEPTPIDPNVVDPTVEEVIPAAPTGRRSMGFFARS